MMTIRTTRRRVITWSGSGGLAAVGAGCVFRMRQPVAALPAAVPSPGPVTARISPRIRLHMFQTGWVAVKRQHKAYNGPSGLRFAAIMGSRSWTDWLPVTAFVVDHPEELIVIDTGETAQILHADYAACDPGTGLFYRRNLQFSLTDQDELGPQMRRAGLDPDRVSTVILTHLHSDHMGGLRHFPRAGVLVSERARGGHTGALMCRIPRGLTLRPVSLQDEPVGVFGQTAAVTKDASVVIVPTPGHASGHQSVLLQDNGASVCIVGDAAFSLDQIIGGDIGGIVDDVAQTRASAAALRRQFEGFGTLMLPTHDPDNAARLRSL